MNTRETMVHRLARYGLTEHETERVLRDLPAIQRAHEAACMAWPEETIRAFQDKADRAFRRVATILESVNGQMRAVRQTDPRGCTVALYRRADDPESAEPFLRLAAEGFTAAELERIDRYAKTVRS